MATSAITGVRCLSWGFCRANGQTIFNLMRWLSFSPHVDFFPLKNGNIHDCYCYERSNDGTAGPG